MRFPPARRPEQDQIRSLLEPGVPGAERHDLGLGDHRHGLEVVGGEGLAGQELRVPEVALEAAPIPFGELVLGERGEQAGGGPAFLVAARGDLLPHLLDCRQTQLIQHQRQARHVDGIAHAASPEASPRRSS